MLDGYFVEYTWRHFFVTFYITPDQVRIRSQRVISIRSLVNAMLSIERLPYSWSSITAPHAKDDVYIS